MPSLYELTQSVMELQELLEAGDIDEQVYADSIESMCIDGKLENICKMMKNLEAKANAYKAEIDRMTARKRALENGAKRLKDSVFTYMMTAEANKIEAGLFTLSLGSTKSVNVTDVDRLPREFVIPQDPKIDKNGLAKAIKNGEAIEGAELVESAYLTIR